MKLNGPCIGMASGIIFAENLYIRTSSPNRYERFREFLLRSFFGFSCISMLAFKLCYETWCIIFGKNGTAYTHLTDTWTVYIFAWNVYSIFGFQNSMNVSHEYFVTNILLIALMCWRCVAANNGSRFVCIFWMKILYELVIIALKHFRSHK